MSSYRSLVVALVVSCSFRGTAEDLLALPGLSGRAGGRLLYAQRAEPKTLNPFVAFDAASREVIQLLMADLVHINRETLQTEPALAKSWSVSPDGRQYLLDLRQGIRFSDGQPFDADDVVFTFQVVLDEKLHAPQRDLLLLEGKPIRVRKLDQYRVAFDLPAPYAAAERLFDGFQMLPRHLLARTYEQGKIADAWSLRAAPAEIAGLGPYRLKESVPGQRIVLERNPNYWKTDQAGRRLPYLDTVHLVVAGTDDMQVLRFQSGESDILTRPGAKSFALLEQEAGRKGLVIRDAGAGFEYNFLFFNLNRGARPPYFRRRSFRQAVSAAIDRDALVRLVYLGHASPLSGPVPPGNKLWLNRTIPAAVRSIPRARGLLSADGFRWAPDGMLLSPEGTRVEFSIAMNAANPDRVQMATLIQNDLKDLGIRANIAPLESRSLLDRVQRTYDYDAAIMSLASADADPNPDMSVWLSSGGLHLWQPQQATPATPWESEIDGLMRRQMVTRLFDERKRMFDRVQELLVENVPLIPLVSPHVLAGARKGLENFHPALLNPNTLWNVEQLYWSGR